MFTADLSNLSILEVPNKSFRERNENDLRKPTNDGPDRPDNDQVVDDWLLERQCALNKLKEIIFKTTVTNDDGSKEIRELRSLHMNRMIKFIEIEKTVGWSNPLRGIQLSRIQLFS